MSDLMTQIIIIVIKVHKSNSKISPTYQSEVKAPSNKPAVY